MQSAFEQISCYRCEFISCQSICIPTRASLYSSVCIICVHAPHNRSRHTQGDSFMPIHPHVFLLRRWSIWCIRGSARPLLGVFQSSVMGHDKALSYMLYHDCDQHFRGYRQATYGSYWSTFNS